MRKLLALFLLLAACAPPPPPGNDARVDGSDATAAMDSALDAEAAAPDVAEADATESFDDVVIDYGMCGRSVRECLCGCAPGSATCQQACTYGDDDCGGCLYNSLTACCPAETTEFEACIDRSMCSDDACIAMACAREYRALNSCAQRSETGSAACLAEVRGCLGDDYPRIRCVRTGP